MRAALLILAIAQVFAFQPNVGGFLDLAWLNKTSQTAVPLIEGLLEQYVDIPQFNTTVSTPLGDMYIKVTDVKLANLQLDTQSTGFYVEDNSLYNHFLLKDANATFGYDVKYSFFHYSGQGWADLTNLEGRLGGTLVLNGETPQISLKSHSLSVGGVKIHTQLSSFLEGIIQNLINSNIPTIQTDIDQAIVGAVNNFNTNADTYTFEVDLPQVPVAINLRPESSLTFKNTWVGGFLNGTVFDYEDPVEYSGAHGSVPLELFNSEPLQGSVSDFVVNEFNANFYRFLDVDLRNVTFPFPLTTSNFTDTLPQLEKTFGSEKPVSFILQGDSDFPVVETKSGTISASGTLNVTILVNTGSWQEAVTFGITGSAAASGSLNGANLKANIASVSLDKLKISNSKIGDLDADAMKANVNQILQSAIANINPIIADYTIEYPTFYGVTIKSITAQIATGYSQSGVDFTVTAPQGQQNWALV